MKYYIISLIIGFLLLTIPIQIYATSPDIYGSVKSRTNAPIPNVTVLWVDALGNNRTTTTDNTGGFFFPSWQNLGNGGGFGCLESPHTWTVIAGANDCSSLRDSYDNVGSSRDIGTIICGPAATPTPSATPTPTPCWGQGQSQFASGIFPSPTVTPFHQPTPTMDYFRMQVGSFRTKK